MSNIEYIKLLLAKFDGKDVTKQLRKYQGYKEPPWYAELRPEDAVFKLMSSRVPNEYIVVSTNSSLKGLRLGPYRPDIVECLWVGYKFNIHSVHIESVLYSDLPNALAAKVDIDIEELTAAHRFVKQMYVGVQTNG